MLGQVEAQRLDSVLLVYTSWIQTTLGLLRLEFSTMGFGPSWDETPQAGNVEARMQNISPRPSCDRTLQVDLRCTPRRIHRNWSTHLDRRVVKHTFEPRGERRIRNLEVLPSQTGSPPGNCDLLARSQASFSFDTYDLTGSTHANDCGWCNGCLDCCCKGPALSYVTQMPSPLNLAWTDQNCPSQINWFAILETQA
jgi:hypothetical protein